MADNNGNSLGMDKKTASWFAYVISIISAIIILATEKDDKTVRTHAWQSLVLGVIFVIGYIVLLIIWLIVMAAGGWGAYFVFAILYAIWGVGWVVLTVICIMKALNDDIYKIPVVYGISEKFNK